MEPCDVCGRELRSVNHAAGQGTCGRADCLLASFRGGVLETVEHFADPEGEHA